MTSRHSGDVEPDDVVPAVRLARHRIRLDDGHAVGVAIAGRGMPLVVAHGFTAQGLLYVQTLSRLVSMGFKVVAIDVPGHGATSLPRRWPLDLRSYARILSRAVAHLGIRQAVLLGHSMGGRLVCEMAGEHPDRVVSLVLVDAIVGRPWDLQVARVRWFPALGITKLVQLWIDCAYSLPVLGDPAQSLKLASLLIRASLGANPARLTAPALAMSLASPSQPLLDRLGGLGVPAAVIHADRDLAVPIAAGRDAAARLHAELATVLGARHGWLLSDPETLPAIMGRLLSGPLGDAWAAALVARGFDPAGANIDDIERAFYDPGARILALTPPLSFTRSGERRRLSRYRWTIEPAPTLKGDSSAA